MNDFFLNYPDNKLRNCITNDILSNSDSLKYHKTLEEYSPTPLYDLKNLARELGVGKIYVKDESKRFNLNAFKGLGASYAVHKVLSLYPNISVFCTATDGNHGRAVAWSATKHNKKSIIYVPKQTTEARIKAIANHGSEVIQLDLNYQDTCQYASNISKKMNWTLIQDTSWENYEEIPAYIMSGYLTHLREMEDSINTLDHPGVDIIFLQCGVGSWPATCIWYYINRYFKKKPKIVLVEPDESSGVLQSLLSNKRVTPKGSLDTIMAGLNCGIPSMCGWEIIKSGCDAAISISDEYAKRAIRALYFPISDDKRVISGESGAAGLGGLIKCLEVNKFNVLRKHIGLNSKSEILFINTEGNTDPESFKSIISSN